jgi:RimJ/RimL family protein N-acetyltransferase
VDTVFAIYGDPATNTFNPFGPLKDRMAAEAKLRRWIDLHDREGLAHWAVATREHPDDIIGFGGLSRTMYGAIERINLGYRFATKAWGNGYATEVARAALRHGFDDMHYDEVHALVRPTHAASIRVLEKIGMRFVGTLDDAPGAAASMVFAATRGCEIASENFL